MGIGMGPAPPFDPPSRWDACRARRRNFVDRARDRFGMNLDRRAPWPRRIAPLRSFAMRRAAQRRCRSSIITAHAKLQVHVISRPWRGKRFRPVGGRFRMIKRIRAQRFCLRRGAVMRDRPHRYIHHDSWQLHKRTRKCAPVAGEKGNAASVTRALRRSRKHKQKSRILAESASSPRNPPRHLRRKSRYVCTRVYRSDQKSIWQFRGFYNGRKESLRIMFISACNAALKSPATPTCAKAVKPRAINAEGRKSIRSFRRHFGNTEI